MTTGTLSREDRAALARSVLARAELRTGARSARVRTGEAPGRAAEPPVGTVVPATEPTSEVPPAAEHAVLALVEPLPSDEPAERPGVTTSLITTERPPLRVPPPLAPLLPDGLRRGATTAVLGSTSLVLTLLAHACAGGSWAAVVGQPTVGLLAAAQAGVDLERLAVVPRPGVETPTVVAALLDGMDVVVVGPEAVLTDADRRRLSARARDRGSVLLSTVAWAGAGTVLTVEAGRWTGAGAGDGRLRTHELRVTRSGRGGAAVPLSLDLVLPLGAAGELDAVGRADEDVATAPVEGGAADGTSGLRLVG